jgi:hypothetical protein
MKRKSRVCGEFPKVLFRFFSEEQYAVRFAKEGKLRAGLISEYRRIESSVRRDETEGSGHYLMKERVTSLRMAQDMRVAPEVITEDGIQHHYSSFGNSVFLVCCSDASVDVSLMKERFGRYMARIHSPVSLAIDLDYALNKHEGSGRFLIDGEFVEYNKGLLVNDGRRAENLTDLAFMQKPASFADEKEFRFCLVGFGEERLEHLNKDKYLDIDLGGELRYVELL